MCCTCCADLAVKHTLQGEWATFAWGTFEGEDDDWFNDPHTVQVDGPVWLFVQAEAPQGVESPGGRIRIAFDIERPSDWVECQSVAGACADLGVDTKWSALEVVAPKLVAMLKAHDTHGLLQTIRDGNIQDAIFMRAMERYRPVLRSMQVHTLAKALHGHLQELGKQASEPIATELLALQLTLGKIFQRNKRRKATLQYRKRKMARAK